MDETTVFRGPFGHRDREQMGAERGSTSCSLELERDTVVAGRAEQLSVVGSPEDVAESSFMARHPLDGRQSTDGPVDPLTGNLLFLDEDHHTGEQTLQEVQEVRDGRDSMPQPGE